MRPVTPLRMIPSRCGVVIWRKRHGMASAGYFGKKITRARVCSEMQMTRRLANTCASGSPMRLRFLRALLCLLDFTATVQADEAEDALRSWGGLEKARLNDLAAGKIVTDCNASMKFARGISTKAAYFLNAPIGVT